ncbi:glycosyltransferase family 4 protein [Undibacterium sp. SXout20W]|uniref:glycosyltransferase family 4 protein n=1 Tax=Undibacterium sp. SXout20W TaxID=3413051 RepID=UPI003BF1B2F8
MLKILYHHRTSSKDGQAVHIEEMIAAFKSLGHKVIVVAPEGSQKTGFGVDDRRVAFLKRYMPRFIYELMELAYNWVSYRELAKAIKLHQPDCIYERYNLFLLSGIWAKRRFHLPLILEVNSPIFEERLRYDGFSLHRIAKWCQTYIWKSADFVLPVTQVMADIVLQYGSDPKKTMVIHNGINLHEFEEIAAVESAKMALGLHDKLVLGFTGFIRKWHGLDKVISMLANDEPDSRRHLLVVGDGPERVHLEAQAKSLNIQDRVSFTGLIERNEIPTYIAMFDIALQPAVVAYASPLKLIEYLAAGKAIVAPNQPNIGELLTDQDNALLFDPNRPGSMPETINRLCRDQSLIERLQKNARSTINEKQLTWESNAKKIIGLIEGFKRHA